MRLRRAIEFIYSDYKTEFLSVSVKPLENARFNVTFQTLETDPFVTDDRRQHEILKLCANSDLGGRILWETVSSHVKSSSTHRWCENKFTFVAVSTRNDSKLLKCCNNSCSVLWTLAAVTGLFAWAALSFLLVT